MKNYLKLKKSLLKDREIKKEYDLLGPQFMAIDKLISLRIKYHLSQKDIATKMGTKQSSISRFERKMTNPTLFFLSKIASICGKRLVISFR